MTDENEQLSRLKAECLHLADRDRKKLDLWLKEQSIQNTQQILTTEELQFLGEVLRKMYS